MTEGSVRRTGNLVVLQGSARQRENVLDDLHLFGGAVGGAVDGALALLVAGVESLHLGADLHAELLLHRLAGQVLDQRAFRILLVIVDGETVDLKILAQ